MKMETKAEAERDYSRKRVTKLPTSASANQKKKRKPLTDLTNFKNPSTITPKPSILIGKPCNPNSNSLNPPLNSSNSSIGSSNSHKNYAQFSSSDPGHGGVEGSKLLVAEREGKGVGLQRRYCQEERAGDAQRTLRSDSVALNIPLMEKKTDRGKTKVNFQLEKTKDIGKATDGAFKIYSAERPQDKGKAADGAFKIYSAERTQDEGKAIAGQFNNHALLKTQDKGKGAAVSSDSNSVESVKDKATEINSIPGLLSLANTRDKGKAAVRPGDLSTAGKRKKTGKGVSSHYSCPPVPRTRNYRNGLNEAEDSGQWEFHTDPQKRRRLPQDQDTPEYNLPADFIEKQRAYYKEVDEFELLEEEV